ncbi:phosphopantetheine-binding protein [Variovorax sp. NFACC26]|uniref:acyl carrier protein n=1 Tax=Variovorax sp. NFACC26 TaxID=1566275 RepID=UPI003AAB0E12
MAWPLWAEGGMRVDAATRDRLWRSAGLVPLGTPEGLSALARALSLEGTPRVTVLSRVSAAASSRRGSGSASRSLRRPRRTLDRSRWTAGDAGRCPEGAHGPSSGAPLRGDAELSEDRVDAEAALERYGVDSVMVTQMTNVLEEDFGTLSKTLFEYQSIAELAGYFIKQHRGQLIGLLGLGGSAQAARSDRSAAAAEPPPGKATAAEGAGGRALRRSPGRRSRRRPGVHSMWPSSASAGAIRRRTRSRSSGTTSRTAWTA